MGLLSLIKNRITVKRGDFLIPGTNVGLKMTNNEIIRVSSINSFKYVMNGYCYLTFDNISWQYDTKQSMMVEYNRILRILIPEEEFKYGEFE